MQLPRPAMPAPSFSNDVETKVSLTMEIAIDIVRLQGEELIRVRRELEKSEVRASQLISFPASI